MDQKKKKKTQTKNQGLKKKTTTVSGQWKATKQQQHVIGYPASELNFW